MTRTPTLTPTVTTTPGPYQEGSVSLVSGDQLDLDAADLNPGSGTTADLAFTYGGSPLYVLTPLNGAMWVVIGESIPAYSDCEDAILTSNAIAFETVPVGTSICYQTSGDLLGRLTIKESAGESLSLDHLTWTIP